ncbi:alpha/beta hydrolase family protein [Pseudarthrobacter sp. So.54]
MLENGQLRLLTDFSAPLRSGAGILEPLELTIPSTDGYIVHGWLVKPPGEGPHPVLLNIHGGPFAQFTGALFDEAQVYADAGYAVLMCNPVVLQVTDRTTDGPSRRRWEPWTCRTSWRSSTAR